MDTAEEQLHITKEKLREAEAGRESSERLAKGLERERDKLEALLEAKDAELAKTKAELEETLRSLGEL